MKKDDAIKTMLGIAFLYTIFSGTISLLKRFAVFIMQGDYEKSIVFLLNTTM
jgi:hypothetical protein